MRRRKGETGEREKEQKQENENEEDKDCRRKFRMIL